jgi:hypothetical protein
MCVQVNQCLSIKGAEDTINKPNAFEISTRNESMFFIADSEKVKSSHGHARLLDNVASWALGITLVCASWVCSLVRGQVCV